MLLASGASEYPPTFTKVFVLPLKKCVSSVYSQLKACLMSESVANLPASRELLMVAKIWKLPGVWSKLHREVFHNLLATVLYLMTVRGPVISICLDTLRSTWLGRKFTPNTAMKQTVTSCLLPTNTWHQFLLHQDTSLGAMTGPISKCRWWIMEVWCVKIWCNVNIKVRIQFFG